MPVKEVTLHLSWALVMSIALSCLLAFSLRTLQLMTFELSACNCCPPNSSLLWLSLIDWPLHQVWQVFSSWVPSGRWLPSLAQLYRQTDSQTWSFLTAADHLLEALTARWSTGARTGGWLVYWYCSLPFTFSLGAADLSAAEEDHSQKHRHKVALLCSAYAGWSFRKSKEYPFLYYYHPFYLCTFSLFSRRTFCLRISQSGFLVSTNHWLEVLFNFSK